MFARLTFYVISGKLDGELENLYRIIDELGGKVVSLEHARFVLTAIRGRPRLLRALGSYIVSLLPSKVYNPIVIEHAELSNG